MTGRILRASIAVAGLLSLLYAFHHDPWSAPPASADHCAVRPTVSRPTLQMGSAGDQVAVLQVALTTAGFSSGYLDGLFGSPEDAAAKSFQQSRGLPATGIVDSSTWAALDPYIDPADRHAAPQPNYTQLVLSFNSAGFNLNFPGHPYYGLQAMDNGARGARFLRSPYVPPTLLKAIGWIEANWRQSDSGGAPVISFDCGYGVMQITAPGIPLDGIAWSMYGRAPEPVYSQVQVPLTSNFNVNVAIGAKTLAAKWNLAPSYRPIVGSGDQYILEDWYYAVWSYNGFVSSNHPDRFNGLYPLRGEYSCDLRDGFNHNRTQFAYQELVFGCVKHPPVVDGTPLWSSIPTTLPASVPPLDPAQPSYPASMDIPTPQPAHTDPTPGTPPPSIAINGPAPAAVVAQPVVISGWAVDYSAPSGTGIDAVHVYAYPSDASGTPTGALIFLGAATLGQSRPDIATAFGNPGFINSGYRLAASFLYPGFYYLRVFGHSSVVRTWYETQVFVKVDNRVSEGSVIKGTGPELYVISSGLKRWIPNPPTFEASTFRWGDVFTVPDGFLQAIPAGESLPDTLADGNLLKGPGPAVYVTQAGIKRHILGPQAFSSCGYGWDAIRPVSDDVINSLPSGPSLNGPPCPQPSFADGTLVIGSGSQVYLIADGGKHWITGQAFSACGYSWANLNRIADSTLNGIPTGESVTACAQNGTLLKGAGATVFVIQGGLKRWIPGPETFEAYGFSWDNIATVSDASLHAIPNGPALLNVLAEGNLLKGPGPAVYVMGEGQKRHISSLTAFTACGYNWDAVFAVSDASLNALPPGTSVDDPPCPGSPFLDGSLLKGSADHVYIIEGGMKRFIPGPQIFTDCNYHWDDIRTISDVTLSSLPSGSSITGPPDCPQFPYDDSTLLQGSGPAIYVMDGGSKRWVNGPDIFNTCRYRWGNVNRIADSILNRISEGARLTSPPCP